MFFNSFQFAGFFLLVWFGTLMLRPRILRKLFSTLQRRHALDCRNLLLLVASYVFYGGWDWRFLGLIILSTLIDFVCGRNIARHPAKRKSWLLASLITNLGMLGFFKYYDFFAQSFADMALAWGYKADPVLLGIVLPVGISFYTFQTLSYVIDIYRGHLKPEPKLLNFALFVAFFPQLVAGPIERARDLLPQFRHIRSITLDKVNSGVFLIAVGLFKKVVIADNLSPIADQVFALKDPSGAAVWIGVVAFALQIFCDFSGYSDIARGSARCLGFELSLNFNMPYFAASPSEFWRRWHITLSTWLRDYLYVPLGGNRSGSARTYVNLMLTMLLGGLWHGAAWTFVVWGAFHGVLLCLYRAVSAQGWRFTIPSLLLRRVLRVANLFFFFNVVCVSWLLFRAKDMGQAKNMLLALFSGPPFEVSALGLPVAQLAVAGFAAALLLTVQLLQHLKNDLWLIYRAPVPVRSVLYAFAVVLFVLFGEDGGEAFIYFQF